MAHTRNHRHSCSLRRRGVTALLAMLYLILFSTLALGFYAATMLSIEVTRNDTHNARSMMAAESGMDFMRVAMSRVSPPAGKTHAALLADVKTSLASLLEPTGNLDGQSVAFDGSSVIDVPAIALGTNTSFATQVRTDSTGTKLIVTTSGISGTSEAASRGVSLSYVPESGTNPIFATGVVSKSAIAMHSNAVINSSILIASMSNPALDMASNSSVSGGVSLVNPSGTVTKKSNAEITGSVVTGVPEPTWPTIDTSAFEPYAVNVLSVSGKQYNSGSLKNIRIKANTNPIFDSNLTIDGVIYIETPNKVEFKSNVKIRGAIVVQNNPTGSTSTNQMLFDSNVKLTGVETLPDTAEWAGLRAMTGSLILAPTFKLYMHSNAGTTGGSIVAGHIELHSNANITVKGSVINLEDTAFYMHSNARITIQDPGANYHPAGMSAPGKYGPDLTSYAEN